MPPGSPLRARPTRTPSGRRTGASSASASICRQSAFRAPPPTTRTASTAMPSARIRSTPQARLSVTPSSARRNCRPCGSARRSSCESGAPPAPSSTARACGRSGTRSPQRYGSHSAPPHPGGSTTGRRRQLVERCRRVLDVHLLGDVGRSSSRTSSGSQPPVASQKGAMSSGRVDEGRALYVNAVPEVPQAHDRRRRAASRPLPTALHMLSPLPADDRHARARARARGALGAQRAGGLAGVRAAAATSTGRRASIARAASSRRSRAWTGSKSPVPEASPASIVRAAGEAQVEESCGREHVHARARPLRARAA